jgi:hypothetical protein
VPHCFDARVTGLRAPALGPQPVGVRVRLGCGDRLHRLEIEGLSRPIFQGRARHRALVALWFGEVDPCQGLRLVLPPLPDPGYRWGCLFGGLPACALPARGLLAPLLGHSVDGSGARGNRVHPQITEPLDLAPRASLHRLDDPPLQGPHPPITPRPVDAVPG